MALPLRNKTPALPNVPSEEALEDPKMLREFLLALTTRLHDVLDDLLFIETARSEISDSRERLRVWKEDT